MHVLLTTDTVGGVWTFTRELAAELLHRGHAVALISFGRGSSPCQAEWAAASANAYPHSFRYEFTEVPLEWMTDNDRVYADGAEVLSRTVRDFRPDLLHSSQFCYGALPVAVPRLVTAHGDLLSWAAACRPGGFERSAWVERCLALMRAGLAGADAISTPTRWMAEQLERHFRLPCKPEVILNGRTLPPATGPGEPGERALQAISAGRLWDEAKNTTLLLHVDSPMPILLAGERKLGDAQTELAARHLTLLGPLSPGELFSRFRQSSVYLATSRYEPFGLAPLEAALCGCAILANDLPSLREIWSDAALYFHDPSSLEALLRELAAHPALLEAARHRSELHARELTAARMADGYLALYARLLASRSALPVRRGAEALVPHAF